MQQIAPEIVRRNRSQNRPRVQGAPPEPLPEPPPEPSPEPPSRPPPEPSPEPIVRAHRPSHPLPQRFPLAPAPPVSVCPSRAASDFDSSVSLKKIVRRALLIIHLSDNLARQPDYFRHFPTQLAPELTRAAPAIYISRLAEGAKCKGRLRFCFAFSFCLTFDFVFHSAVHPTLHRPSVDQSDGPSPKITNF